MTATRPLLRLARPAVALVAALMIVAGLFGLGQAREGVALREATVGSTPVTVASRAGGPPGPAVVIAHGFAGSRPLMQSYALALARAGFVAVSFDFLGHGRNPMPLTGSILAEDGATRALVAETQAVLDFARGLPEADGRVALLGHSMASDIIVRTAMAEPDVAAVVAISMFSPVVTATEPRNLLVIAGEWEGGLVAEGLRVLRLAEGSGTEAGRTVGDPAAGTGRRLAVAPGVEHVGVLFSGAAVAEARAWLEAAFGRAPRPDGDPAEERGLWILVLLAGILAAGWPLAGALPRLRNPGADEGQGWRVTLTLGLGAAVLTPLALLPLPADRLPLLVGGYLALHILLYGALMLAGLRLIGAPWPRVGLARLVAPTAALVGWTVLVLGLKLDQEVASVLPTPGRIGLFLILAIGVLPYFVADAWATRGPGAPLGGAVLAKLLVLVSLGIAVGLRLEELFFLIILLPVMVLFFLVYGLFGAWAYARTGHPLPGAIASALGFALAIAGVFPQLG